jgi:hypothetical protein
MKSENMDTYIKLWRMADAALQRFDWDMFDTLTDDMEEVWEKLSEAEQEAINKFNGPPEEDTEAFTNNPTL